MLRILFILMVIAFSSQAYAIGTCLEPSEPDCASNEETYTTKENYEACTKKFEEMSKEAKQYINCMKDELKKEAEDVQKKSDEISDKTNAAIKKFNCRANPKAAC